MKFYKKDEYAVTMIEHDSSADEVLTACRQSKKQRYLCYQQRRLLVNQQPIIQNCPLKPGDELAIRVFIDEAIDFLPDALPLDIVYELSLIHIFINAVIHLRIGILNQISANHDSLDTNACLLQSAHDKLDVYKRQIEMQCQIAYLIFVQSHIKFFF